jgi:hypothetical protein
MSQFDGMPQTLESSSEVPVKCKEECGRVAVVNFAFG